MRSFRRKPDNRRAVYLQLVGSIDSQLREAYARLHHEGGETQSSVAAKLGVDRSAVNRRLSGQTNMTVETLADMVWALGQCIKVDIFDPADHPSNEARIVPAHPANAVISEPEQVMKSMSVRTMSSNGTYMKPRADLVFEGQS